ncbi:hypothetical protein LG3211_5371 [Lysobacter gummosus]|nr:hypothetical protein LG3211_5371 [Lysobacter gummosus]
MDGDAQCRLGGFAEKWGSGRISIDFKSIVKRLLLLLLEASAFARHSRERGNPGPFVRERLKSLDSRVRGNDEQKMQ